MDVDGKKGSEKGCDLFGTPAEVASDGTVSVDVVLASLRIFDRVDEAAKRAVRARRQVLQIMMSGGHQDMIIEGRNIAVDEPKVERDEDNRESRDCLHPQGRGTSSPGNNPLPRRRHVYNLSISCSDVHDTLKKNSK